MTDVGIVGFGRCGRLAAEVLSGNHRVTVTDARDRSGEAAAAGIAWGDLPTVARNPWVVLAVPIRSLPAALDALVPHLVDDVLVVDLASVKERPMAWMDQRLPAGVARVGTHPLFGPDSVRARGLAGQRIAVCPAPGWPDAAERVVAEARVLGLEPVVVDAEAHDREMARSQALVFLVARALGRAGIGETDLATPSEDRLWDAMALVAGDTDELYEDILTYNPWAAERARALRDALAGEIERLGMR